MSQQPKLIRSDMHPDRREELQPYSMRYLDSFFYEAFTARTRREIESAGASLTDVQGQCLRHIRFLSEIESFHREAVAGGFAYDLDEDAYTDLMSFISGVGASVAGVSHQLGFSPPSSDTKKSGGSTGQAGEQMEHSGPQVNRDSLFYDVCQDGKGTSLAQIRNFPGGDAEMYPADLERMAAQMMHIASRLRSEGSGDTQEGRRRAG